MFVLLENARILKLSCVAYFKAGRGEGSTICPFHNSSFHFVDGFLYYAEVLVSGGPICYLFAACAFSVESKKHTSYHQESAKLAAFVFFKPVNSIV